jgi:microcystin-dependent protein
MTETSLPWAGDGDSYPGDHGPYSDDTWASFLMLAFQVDDADQGVIAGVDNELEVVASSPAAKSVDVSAGVALPRGRFYRNDAALTLDLAENISGNPRIDRVALRIDHANQTVRAVVLQGAPAASPAAPALTQIDGITWEIPLAQVYLEHNYSTVTAADIVDEREMVNTGAEHYAGDIKMAFRSTNTPGWVWADGSTIGNPDSGADWAGNNAKRLFIHLWNEADNAVLPILDGGGSASTRGASALADWRADKRLPLPDLRGRFPLGLDDLGGTSANRVTGTDADVLGGSGGAEDVTLTEAQMPSHTHPRNPSEENEAVLFGSGSYTVDGSGTYYYAVKSTTGAAGGGNAHENMPPWLGLAFEIKY